MLGPVPQPGAGLRPVRVPSPSAPAPGVNQTGLQPASGAMARLPSRDQGEQQQPQCGASWGRTCGEEPDSPEHILRRCLVLMTVRFRLFGTIFPTFEDVRRSDAVAAWWRPPGSYRAVPLITSYCVFNRVLFCVLCSVYSFMYFVRVFLWTRKSHCVEGFQQGWGVDKI